jgi:21S rRNA (GM2251-2'-O)-methyltransferase
MKVGPLDMVESDQVDLQELKSLSTPPVLVVLDQVMDPQNLGAIIRSCFFFGAHKILISRRETGHLSGVVAKASAGAMEHANLGFLNRVPRFLKVSV